MVEDSASAQQTPMRSERSLRDEYPDYKRPRRAGENRWIVTMCAGFDFYYMNEDRSPATGVTSSWNNVQARPHGTDGSIYVWAGSKDGDYSDVTWKQNGVPMTLTVRVVNCREKPKTVGDPPPPPPPPPPPTDPPLPPFPQPPRGTRQPTHRTAKCAQCRDVIDRLNAASDKLSKARESGATYQAMDLSAEVSRLAKEADACEKKCAGTSMRTKAMIGAGAAAGTAFAFAGGGNPPAAPPQAPITATNPPAPTGQSPPAAPAPNPQPSPAPAPNPQPDPGPTPAPNPTGTYTIRLAVTSDPGRHDPHTLYSGVNRIDVQVDGPSVRISGPYPWVTVMGTYSPSTGGFTADGNGTVAGIANVPVSVTGTFSGPSLTFGQIQVGPTNLPGNVAELLNGTGTKQ